MNHTIQLDIAALDSTVDVELEIDSEGNWEMVSGIGADVLGDECFYSASTLHNCVSDKECKLITEQVNAIEWEVE